MEETLMPLYRIEIEKKNLLGMNKCMTELCKMKSKPKVGAVLSRGGKELGRVLKVNRVRMR